MHATGGLIHAQIIYDATYVDEVESVCSRVHSMNHVALHEHMHNVHHVVLLQPLHIVILY